MWGGYCVEKEGDHLVDIWEHVGEAGGEDDPAAEHGETGEEGHHGGGLGRAGGELAVS